MKHSSGVFSGQWEMDFLNIWYFSYNKGRLYMSVNTVHSFKLKKQKIILETPVT